MIGWSVFAVLIITMIVVDLGVFHRKVHEISIKESMIWTVVWFSLALLFNVFVFYTKGSQASIDFLTGYLVEKSLSLDNVFVFLTIFQAFKIPLLYQHRILFWGIIGAVILRGVFIGLGTILVQQFSWIFYIFGVFLIYTAYKFMQQETHQEDVTKSPLIHFCEKYLPVTKKLHGQNFFIVENGKKLLTPLFLALVAIEFSDVIFAIDSIPAVFAITTDPFIVFTSNIFAILGLRSLYFIIANMALKFIFLSYGLGFILGFIGIKMLVHELIEIPSLISLSIIGFALSISIISSLIFERKKAK